MTLIIPSGNREPFHGSSNAFLIRIELAEPVLWNLIIVTMMIMRIMLGTIMIPHSCTVHTLLFPNITIVINVSLSKYHHDELCWWIVLLLMMMMMVM